MNAEHPRTFVLNRIHDITGVSGPGTVAHGVVWPDGSVALRWCVGEHRSTVIHASVEAVEAVHGHGGNTIVEYTDDLPGPDLSRITEMDGYLQELAHETGDDGPLQFWREIKRSIRKPILDHIRRTS